MVELGFVYRVINSRNKKCYIGETLYPYHRFTTHLNRPQNSRLRIDIDRFGKRVFEFEILEICLTTKERKALELYYIDKYKATDPRFGYNSTKKGFPGPRTAAERNRRKRFMRSKKYRLKMSVAARKQWNTPGMRQKMKAAAISGWETRRAKFLDAK